MDTLKIGLKHIAHPNLKTNETNEQLINCTELIIVVCGGRKGGRGN